MITSEQDFYLAGFVRAVEDRESYQCRVARKAALSNWLAEAAKEKISQEVDEANFQVSSLLSSNAISRLTLKFKGKCYRILEQVWVIQSQLRSAKITFEAFFSFDEWKS